VPDDLKSIEAYFARFWIVLERASTGDRSRGLNDAIVGMAGVQDIATDSIEPALAPFIKTERTMRLHRVSVAPERWRLGIGRQLVQTALEWARLNGYGSLVLETTPQQEAAVALYLTMGFTEIGRTKFGVWDLMWFERKLM
jgi:GNAT superfamily N-acetyltransferase